MAFINEIVRFFLHFSGPATFLSVICLVLTVWLVIYAWRWRRFTQKWRTLMTGTSGQNLEVVLYDQLRAKMQMEDDVHDLLENMKQVEANLKRCVQNVSIVRFNAFEDVGGEQSFALALFDGNGDGTVISTVYGRVEGRVYAKELKNCAGIQTLTAEEEAAIALLRPRTLAE
ncbi:MAG: DUF4446 family protein [bacterium]